MSSYYTYHHLRGCPLTGSEAVVLDLASRGHANSQIGRQVDLAENTVKTELRGSVYGKHKGGDMDTWPEDLRVREFPQTVAS